MTKFSKVLFLGAAVLCLASTAAVAKNYDNSRNNAWLNDNSAAAPQVLETRAGNPHRDAGSSMPSQKMARQMPAEPTAQDANAISRPTTKAGDPHRDPANANSAYFDADAKLSSHDSPSAKMRMTNRQVRAVQQNLKSKGYALRTDGIWGPQTASAVRDFQADSRLQATGRLDNETLRALNANYRSRMPDRMPDTSASVDAYGHPAR